METKAIKNFYEGAIVQEKFNSEFWNKLKKISTKEDFKTFIEKKVQPVAKKMGYDFSTEELLKYEEKMAQKITEQQLESISGGVNVKSWILGSMVSLMAFGAGIVGTINSTNAEQTQKNECPIECQMSKETNNIEKVANSEEEINFRDNFEVKEINNNDKKVRLLIKNANVENLIIPSKTIDGKEVVGVGKKEKITLKNLKTLTFEGDFSNLEIEKTTFLNINTLSTVKFNKSVNNLTIDYGVFASCKNLKDFVLPTSINILTIGKGAFDNCNKLKFIKIPTGVTELIIEESAFVSCSALESLEIPNGISKLEIGAWAFVDCENFENFTIPNSVTNLKIGNKAFAFTCLKNLKIHDNVEKLDIARDIF